MTNQLKHEPGEDGHPVLPPIPNTMPNPKNTLKSPTQVAWEAMEATKAKLIEDTKQRIKEIREEVRRLENEEGQLEDILRKQGR